MIFSAVFKAKAREALRNHWQTALLIALIVNLPTLLMQGLSAFTNNDLFTRLEQVILNAYVSQDAYNALPDALRAALTESGVLIMTGLSLLAWLITPVLALGMNHWTLDRIRGAEEPVSTVFSRLRIFLKSIGLRLLVVLKILLWMLPGIAVFLFSVVPLINATAENAGTAVSIAGWMIWIGMILMLVLGMMGYLYYAMADFILADEPEERVLSCIRRSKAMMKDRRSSLMSLLLSFLLWYLLILIAASFVEAIAGSIISLMLQMLGSLFLSVYMLTSEGVFYEALRKASAQQVSVESSDDLEG